MTATDRLSIRRKGYCGYSLESLFGTHKYQLFYYGTLFLLLKIYILHGYVFVMKPKIGLNGLPLVLICNAVHQKGGSFKYIAKSPIKEQKY